jgi:hypothetical protein
MTALLLGVLFARVQPENRELSDGFYCATAHYLAYETLLNRTPGVHLLRVMSLDARATARPDLAIEVAAEPSRRIRCEPSAVTLQGETTTSHVRLDLRSWTAVSDTHASGGHSAARWQTSRLWGTGAWTTTAIQRVALRSFGNGARVRLEIVRLSVGGRNCHSDVGTRIVWLDRLGRETAPRAIFLRQANCQRAGLRSLPLLDDCAPQSGRVLHTFHGRVKADESYSHAVARFRIELKPEGHWGWVIGVRPIADDRDLTSMIPLHGRSGREIQPDDVTLPAQPWLEREFYFHPEMRKTIVYQDDAETMLVDDLRVRAYGRGRLTIERYAMGKDEKGQPRFEWIEFRGCVSWPARRIG